MSDLSANPTPTTPSPSGSTDGDGPMIRRTIVLADDHPVTRHGLRTLLEGDPGLWVVAECGDGRAALEEVGRYRPDLLVSDLSMPGLNGLDVAREMEERSPATRVILVSVHTEEPYLVAAFQRGVRGYVFKDTSAQCLLRAVRAVLAGERYLSPAFPWSLLPPE